MISSIQAISGVGVAENGGLVGMGGGEDGEDGDGFATEFAVEEGGGRIVGGEVGFKKQDVFGFEGGSDVVGVEDGGFEPVAIDAPGRGPVDDDGAGEGFP